MANIYLIPDPVGTWFAACASNPPTETSEVLTSEGSYPVCMFYRRTDLNGSSILEEEVCRDREALLASLNWAGKCAWTIIALWGFDANSGISDGINTIFQKARFYRWERRPSDL